MHQVNDLPPLERSRRNKIGSQIPTPGITEYSPDTGSKTLILGFAFIILVGTVLLSLPIATESGQAVDWREALFTATSATTVTGLIVFGTVDTWSTFGELVILGLIQVGGIGFVTLSVVLLAAASYMASASTPRSVFIIFWAVLVGVMLIFRVRK
jgi:Trk-type K+ transport system membrane component